MRRLPLRSPPRMRGKAAGFRFFLPSSRITPAYAGKRHLLAAGAAVTEDHPRVCGEKAGCSEGRWSCQGSPPRVRGKVQLQPGQPAALGITPACAGKSIWSCSTGIAKWDHPRVCGEKASYQAWRRFGLGSPPRMRGKGVQHGNSWVAVGITPAYAGKSTCGTHADKCAQDHPRVCGEKCALAL